MERNTFKKLLSCGHKPVGSFAQLPCKEIVEIMTYAGIEFVIVDNEHGQMSVEQTLDLVRLAEAGNMATLVRVPGPDHEDDIKRALDMGASGIMVPNVNTVEQAKQVIRYAKFAPLGLRGACPYVRANRYSKGDTATFFERANSETAIVLLLEGPEAVEHVDEICALEGVDAVNVGLMDLAVKMGYQGDMEHPVVKDAVQKVIQSAHMHGKAYGGFAVTFESAKALLDDDIDFLIYADDTNIVTDAYAEVYEKLIKR